MIEVGLNHYLAVSSILFALGIYGVITRKNAVMVLMGVELILNAANINFVALVFPLLSLKFQLCVRFSFSPACS